MAKEAGMRIYVSTAGESHGRALLTVVEGLPAGVPLAAADVDADLARRQTGYGRGGRQAIEADAWEEVLRWRQPR